MKKSYRISGVWISDGVIQSYAVHEHNRDNLWLRVKKMSKPQVIALVEAKHDVQTWTWNYKRKTWDDGEEVIVVGSGLAKYLKTKPDNQVSDNLGHLINYDWAG